MFLSPATFIMHVSTSLKHQTRQTVRSSANFCGREIPLSRTLRLLCWALQQIVRGESTPREVKNDWVSVLGIVCLEFFVVLNSNGILHLVLVPGLYRLCFSPEHVQTDCFWAPAADHSQVQALFHALDTDGDRAMARRAKQLDI